MTIHRRRSMDNIHDSRVAEPEVLKDGKSPPARPMMSKGFSLRRVVSRAFSFDANDPLQSEVNRKPGIDGPVRGILRKTSNNTPASPSNRRWGGRRRLRFDMKSIKKYDPPPKTKFRIDSKTKSKLWYSKQEWQTRRATDQRLAMEDPNAFKYLLNMQALNEQPQRSSSVKSSRQEGNNDGGQNVLDDTDLENPKIGKLVRNVSRGIRTGNRGLEVWNPMTGQHKRERIRQVIVSIVACSQLFGDSAELLCEQSIKLSEHCRVVARRMGHADYLAALAIQQRDEAKGVETS